MNDNRLYHQTAEFHIDDPLLDLVLGARVVAGRLLNTLEPGDTSASNQIENHPSFPAASDYLSFWLGVVATAQKIVALVDQEMAAADVKPPAEPPPVADPALRDWLR